MSSRLGMCHLHEAVEEVPRVVRARAGSGVVLDGAAGNVLEHEALDRAVVEIYVGELGGAEIGVPVDGLSASTCVRRRGRPTAKPWFCEVISILARLEVLTGWLAPRWPKAA